MNEKDTRTYITLDVLMPENVKFIELSTEACWLFIEALCYCGRNLTDGLVTNGWLKRYARNPEVAGELVHVGLLHLHDKGYLVHDYLKHQRSAEEVTEARVRRSEAGRKAGLASGQARRTKAERTVRESLNEGSTTRLNGIELVSVSVSVSLTLEDKNLLVRANSSDEVIMVCCQLLRALIDNGVRQPALTKRGWLDPARLMLERDKRTPAQIARAITFASADEFWRSNVLSISSLRSKYEQLQLKARQSKPATKATKPADSWMNYMPGETP